MKIETGVIRFYLGTGTCQGATLYYYFYFVQ
jgi:hypothetical protein